MLLIENEEAFDKLLVDGTRGEIKFIVIMERFYAIALGELVRSTEYRRLITKPLHISDELLKSFPPPRYDIKIITKELIAKNPIVMFETPAYDNVYYRFDGRHRILAATRLGFNLIHSKLVPRSMWGKYIIGRQLNDEERQSDFLPRGESHEGLPFVWNKPPHLKDDRPSYHIEPNFVFDEKPIVSKSEAVGNSHLMSQWF